MVNYNLGKIYKLVSGDLTYIGSTCEPTLARRLAGHRSDYNRWKAGKSHFVTSFKILEQGNYDMVLIEDCPCEKKDQLHKRERYYIDTLECINKVIPGRTMDEYKKNGIKIMLINFRNKAKYIELIMLIR